MIYLVLGTVVPILGAMLVCMIAELIEDRKLMKNIKSHENDSYSNRIKELEFLMTMDTLVIMSIKKEIRESAPVSLNSELIIDLNRWKEQYRDHYTEYEDLVG